MLSILIPVYNYNITVLVDSLHKQLAKTEFDFEIICLDDVSDEKTIASNIEINELPFTKYELSEQNKGIAISRQLLVKKANYDWIILLDADTELKDDTFITKYVKAINSGYNFVFGGFAYKNIKPQKEYLLRWVYGKRCEAISANKRNKNPYKITIAANILAKKNLYKSCNLDSIGKQYAMDYYLGAILKKNNSKVLHIDNQVYHLGIEKSSSYLRKKEKATETLLFLYDANNIPQHSNDLLSAFIMIRRLKLNYVYAAFYKMFKSIIRMNLLGKYPNVLLLQFYKISYMCHFDLTNKDYRID